jgi:hypothetical protein
MQCFPFVVQDLAEDELDGTNNAYARYTEGQRAKPAVPRYWALSAMGRGAEVIGISE